MAEVLWKHQYEGSIISEKRKKTRLVLCICPEATFINLHLQGPIFYAWFNELRKYQIIRYSGQGEAIVANYTDELSLGYQIS